MNKKNLTEISYKQAINLFQKLILFENNFNNVEGQLVLNDCQEATEVSKDRIIFLRKFLWDKIFPLNAKISIEDEIYCEIVMLASYIDDKELDDYIPPCNGKRQKRL